MQGDIEGTYTITGIAKSGKRFVIHTITPQTYTVWKGSLWYIQNGKRKLITRY
jgi:hypothetical protein